VLRIAILSLLADGDHSGYDLSKAFDASLTYIWPASQSQIYPELKKLEAKGLIDGIDVPQAGRPDKRVYRLTDAGRDELVGWVRAPTDTWALRDPFQLRVINLGRVDPEQAIELVRSHRALVQQRLDILEGIRATLDELGHRPGDPWNDKLGWRLTVEAGVRTAVAYLDWCDWALDQLASSRDRGRAPAKATTATRATRATRAVER